MTELSDTQLLLLSRASQRDDGLLTLPEHLKGAAAQQVVAKLLSLGLSSEVTVPRHAPSWREDDEGRPVGLQITPAGLAAIGLGLEGNTPPPARQDHTPNTADAAWQPRPGTKQALVLSLLSRPDGATLDDLLAATGWLPHSTRAALTGLRQKGCVLERTTNDTGRSVYRAVSAGSVEA